MDNNQLIRPELEDDLEENLETSIRPKLLEEYIGQSKVKENMKIYIEAAKKRGEQSDMALKRMGSLSILKQKIDSIVNVPDRQTK